MLQGRWKSRGISLCAAALAVSALTHSGDSAAAPLAVGVVERVDPGTSSIVVLGQRFYVGPGVVITSGTSSTRVALGAVSPDTMVWLDGQASAVGASRVDAVILLPEMNVPGASQLLVTGVVSAVSSDGRIRVGQLTVDITATLGAPDSGRVSVGDFVELWGTQPLAGGVLLAHTAMRTQGVGGTGTSGVGGTGLSGVGGTGTSGVGGTGLSGVGGTGTSGVGGTGTLGVGGTG